LASQLNLSTMAVSKHLTNFLQEGIVKFEERKQDRGRPVKFWSPTKEADRFFPNTNAKLAVSLIDSTIEALGKEGLNKMLDVHTDKKIIQYRDELSPLPSLSDKIKRLAELRNSEGYLAEFVEVEPGFYQLIENHCPICEVAEKCGELCQSEGKILDAIFGENVKVERVEHIQKDDRRCVYHIRSVCA
jgi:predicted ArsR family transcriptional regulator